MNDKASPSLSEISHLFLSGVRDRATNGAPRPRRIPPSARPEGGAPRPAVSIDLTPEEFARAFEAADAGLLDGEPEVEASPEVSDEESPPRAVSAILASHLHGEIAERLRQYARHLAAEVGRVGLIEVDAGEFRITCFDATASAADETGDPVAIEGFDARRMNEIIEEMAWDVDRWLLALPSVRLHEAREVLRAARHWTILATGDHDEVVASYRTIKSLADLPHPRVSVAVLDAADQAEADGVFRKLAGVSRQFLNCHLEPEPFVRLPRDVAEHVVLHCRDMRDKAQLANAPQWKIVGDLLARSKAPEPLPVESVSMDAAQAETTSAGSRRLVAEVVVPTPIPKTTSTPVMNINDSHEPQAPMAPVAPETIPLEPRFAEARGAEAMPALKMADTTSEVIDLPGEGAGESAILTAILRQAGELAETPVKAPMCPGAVVAVGRDHRVTLVAVAGKGLGELRAIAAAYRWLSENRGLIRMALPQYSIDAHALPALRLLVDHADLSADSLQPLLGSNAVTVQAYRKLKWGAKTGLLLEAA